MSEDCVAYDVRKYSLLIRPILSAFCTLGWRCGDTVVIETKIPTLTELLVVMALEKDLGLAGGRYSPGRGRASCQGWGGSFSAPRPLLTPAGS